MSNATTTRQAHYKTMNNSTTTHQTHYKTMIYLDSAATSLHKPPSVAAAMVDAISNLGNPGRGAHKHALNASRQVYDGRKTVASLFGTRPDKVAFTSSATDSLNIAIGGLISHTDHVITTVLEHNSILRPLYNTGCDISTIDITQDGNLDYAAFERSLKLNTKAVVITTASNLTGLVVDIEFVKSFCKQHGLLLIIDAAQTAGMLPISMTDIHVLCFTGHKSLLGPQGIGGLCANIEILPSKFGGSGVDSFSKTQPTEMPEVLEAGTLNTPGIAGLTAGIAYIQASGMAEVYKKSLQLAEAFYNEVLQIANVKILCNFQLPHVPIVTLNIAGLSSTEVEFRLSNDFEISVRGGAHCAPLLHQSLGTQKQGAVRFSFSSFNAEDDVYTAVKAVRSIADN